MKTKSGVINFVFIFTVLFLVISIIIFPKNSVDAALDAINIWLFTVTPSLFPFFIGSELLIHSGLIDFIGVVLEPIMYPLFRIPGKGSFVFAMSVTSGYPVGASLVSELRTRNEISKDEAQRLIALSSTSGPLFMIGAVSIGMLKNPVAGTLLSISHYLGALTIGLIFRYYGTSEAKKQKQRDNYLKTAFNSLFRLKDKKLNSISSLMSNAIESAFKSIFMIGGFIIIYSVVIEILNITNIIPKISILLSSFIPINLNIDIVNSLFSGLIELTNGCKNIAELKVLIVWKLCIISFLLGWGGFSVHSQAMSFMSKTDINTRLYLFSKVLHGIISSVYTYFLYIYFFKEKIDSVIVSNLPEMSNTSNFMFVLKSSAKLSFYTVVTLLSITVIYSIIMIIKTLLSDNH